MVDWKIYGGATFVVLLSLGFIVYNEVDDPTHYCEDREMMAHCLSLSGTGKTCYTLPAYTGGKRCSSIWQEIEEVPVVYEIDENGYWNKLDFTRDPDGVHCYTKGDLRRKVKCDGV